jgi:hypothetical protein
MLILNALIQIYFAEEEEIDSDGFDKDGLDGSRTSSRVHLSPRLVLGGVPIKAVHVKAKLPARNVSPIPSTLDSKLLLTSKGHDP